MEGSLELENWFEIARVGDAELIFSDINVTSTSGQAGYLFR